MQHTIVFLDRDTVGAPLRQPNFPHTYKEYAETPVSGIVPRLRDATIAILNKVPMRAETLAQLPMLKLIAVAATGTDIVDKLYQGYGEKSGGGMRAGRQAKLFEEGNAYLDREFPLLDKLLRARIVPNESR